MCIDASKSTWLALIALAMAHVRPPLTAAQSTRPRVVWVVPNAALSGAAQKAYEPTQLELIAGTDAVHVAQLGAAFDPGRLARERTASAVVWTGTVGDNAQLYVYDAQSDRVVGTRTLPATPLDAATAAAIVLSVKTYLGEHGAPVDGAPAFATTSDAAARANETGSARVVDALLPRKVGEPERKRAAKPELERADANAGAPQELHSLDRASPARERAAQGESRVDPEWDRVSEPDSVARSKPLQWQLDVAANGGMRLTMHKLGPELRYGLSVQLRPVDAAWRVMVDLSAGTGFRTQRTQLHEPAAALLGVWNALQTRRWGLAIVAGPALHWLLIDVESAGSAQRLRPHIYTGLRVSWHAPAGWFVGAALTADIPLLSQRYWVNEQLVLEARALGVSALINAGAPISL